MPTIEISKIVVANRHRKDMGDINSLANSIREVGLLHPIVLNSSNVLIAGERRLEAVKILGWNEVPVTVADTLDDAAKAMSAERDENSERKPFTASEAAALGARLEAFEKERAAERMKHGKKKDQKTGKFASSEESNEQVEFGRTADKVGKALGISGSSYREIKTVRDRGIPELMEAVDAGEIGTKSASKIALQSPEKQIGLLEDFKAGTYRPNRQTKGDPDVCIPKTRKNPSRKAPEAIRAAIGTFVGLASGLDSFRVKDAAPSPAEAEQWEKDLAIVVSAINRFRRELKEYAHV